jgi:glycosyltransferase involved in cell wall biosynthesis
MYDFDYFLPFQEGFEIFLNEFDNPKNIKVHFYGALKQQNSTTKQLIQFQKKYNHKVSIYGYLPQNELVKQLNKSSIFLNLIGADPSKGYLGTKIFMYACMKKPILSIPAVQSNLTDFFPDPKRSIHFLTFSPNEIAEILKKFYNQFMEEGIVKSDITQNEILGLSREKNVKDFIEILNSHFKSTY